MKRIALLFGIIALVVLAYLLSTRPEAPQEPSAVPAQEPFEIVASDLEIPWEIAFLPGGDMLVTERAGTLLRIGKDKVTIPINGVEHIGEGGLLGLALHPSFAQNKLIYLYLTTREGSGLQNRIERYELNGTEISKRTVIISGIPGARFHDGGRIAFGPDGYLYITMGDAGNPSSAQDINALSGKILRIGSDGSIPEDNPFGSAVYSYGHRNAQGLTWDAEGNLFATEHGRSGVRSGMDEINLIKKGGNYGWPIIEGDEVNEGMIKPIAHSGPSKTWAPAGALYHEGSIFFTGLRGSALYELELSTKEVKEYLHDEFGRLRALTEGPSGSFYISTSNTDGRGEVREGDDKIIKMDPAQLR